VEGLLLPLNNNSSSNIMQAARVYLHMCVLIVSMISSTAFQTHKLRVVNKATQKFTVAPPQVPSRRLVMVTADASKRHSTILGNYNEFLKDYKVVLASQSPRRLEIMELMGLKNGKNLEVQVSSFEENLEKSSFEIPGMYAQVNAQYKAFDIARRVFSTPQEKVLVVGSDTIVEHEGVILEKPVDTKDAHRMLSALSGATHLVHSGVAVFTDAEDQDKPLFAFYETTEVKFVELTDNEIWNYIRTGEPMDKSGSYGIQGVGGQFVERLAGCYFNVMGFPMHRFSRNVASKILSSEN